MNKRIVLIAPSRLEKEIDNFMPQNLGLGYIASYLEKHGHKVSIIDALAEGWHQRIFLKDKKLYLRGLSLKEIINRIPEDTDFIGIAIPFAGSIKKVSELAYFIKKRFPKTPVVSGGITPSIDPLNILANEGIDMVIRGGGEIPMLKLVSGEEYAKINGLVFKVGGEIFNNGSRSELIENLDLIPFPARHLLPMNKYLSLSGRGRKDLRTVSVLTSRGCPFNCTFCSIHHIYGYKWTGRSAENVLLEIDDLIKKYKIQHIEFEDDNLTLDSRRANQIFDGLIKMNKRITWSTPNGIRIDTLNKPLLTKMRRSGCVALFLSIESGDPQVLKIMNKQLDLNKVEEVVKICSELDINTSGIFIVGYPGETAESFEKTVNYINKLRKLGLVGVGASIAKAYPGTELRNMCEKNDYLIDKNRYIEGRAIGEYVDIKTSYFSQSDVYDRLYSIRKKLNPLRYYMDLFYLTAIIKKIFPQWFIDLNKKKVNSFLRR